ncbi:ribonuclease H-like domain-containing protein [Mycena polygramma]|nr:ribonuclease H-like domain-containing protein [Mycena polygramma]
MNSAPTAKTAPLSRKRTERLSPEPGDTGPSDPKRAKPLAPSQSFAVVLSEMSPNSKAIENNSSLAGPHPRGSVDLNRALVFQLVDAKQHDSNPDLVLLFGIAETAVRVMVHITDLQTLRNLGAEVRRYPRAVETFLRHYKIPAASWLELPAGKYQTVDATGFLSHNQTEVKIEHKHIVVQESQSRGAMPLRILGFDIETRVPPDNSFPQYHETAKMQVIQIGNIVEMKGDSSRSYRVIFTLGGCSDIPMTQVNSFTDEASMLSAWRQFVIDSDPDLIVGHNIARFDFVYLILRAEALGLADFACLGRLQGLKAIARKSPFSTMRAWQDAPVLAGRLQLDTYQYIQERRARNNLPTRPGQFTLNAVCEEFLVNEKEDIHFKSINALQDGTDAQRKELAVYCLKDSYLPLRLLDALKCLEEATHAARREKYLHHPFSDFLRRGRNT